MSQKKDKRNIVSIILVIIVAVITLGMTIVYNTPAKVEEEESQLDEEFVNELYLS